MALWEGTAGLADGSGNGLWSGSPGFSGGPGGGGSDGFNILLEAGGGFLTLQDGVTLLELEAGP
jgi:hypothetical protein